jgi:hypothetical protein
MGANMYDNRPDKHAIRALSRRSLIQVNSFPHARTEVRLSRFARKGKIWRSIRLVDVFSGRLSVIWLLSSVK